MIQFILQQAILTMRKVYIFQYMTMEVNKKKSEVTQIKIWQLFAFLEHD